MTSPSVSSRTGAAPPISVFVVDDNRLIREGLASMLQSHGLDVVATARSGAEALREVGRLRPRLVLCDSALSDRATPRFIEDARAEAQEARIAVMGLLPDHRDIAEFIRAGASGFILKDATIGEFIETIVTVAEGGNVLPSSLAGTLFSHVASQVASKGRRGVKSAVRLTKREREVIELIAEGRSNREIGQELNVAIHTVKSHVHNVLEKLALHSRLQVAAFARDRGPGSLPQD